MCGGGGGQSGTTQYNWNEDMAQYWKPELASGQGLSDQPYQRYPGQRIADINSDQNAAMGAIRHFTDSSGSPTTRAADGQAYETLSGNYLRGVDQNPWAREINPFMLQGAQTGRNAYGGDSPYFQADLDAGMDDITGAYQRGTSADTTRMFNLAGAFGGSAHQNAVANNEAQLGKTLSNYATGRRDAQYGRSAGLEESYLGRDLQNQQFDLNRAGQLEENRLGRGMSAFEGERGRQMGAIGAGQNEQQLALQRFNARMGIGDVQRGFNQDILNQNFNDFSDQQQYPYRQADWFSGLLSRAQGGMSPNSTSTQAGYSASPYSQILGAGLMGYGMTR